jgi:rhodanese-related sulfurtransferase
MSARSAGAFVAWLPRGWLGLALVAALACGGGAPAEPPSITPQELLESLDPPLVLDVRSAEEFASGHVPGAVHVPHDQLAARVSELGAPREVVVYCERGSRASKAAAVLRDAGFAVQHLAGDMRGWREAGLPIAR